jgi:hypothetical protein
MALPLLLVDFIFDVTLTRKLANAFGDCIDAIVSAWDGF